MNCKICDQTLEFTGGQWCCFNTIQNDYKHKLYHYVCNKEDLDEYFWYPEYELNINLIDNKVDIYTSSKSISKSIVKENIALFITLEDFKKLKFDPKNVSKLIDKLKLYQLYK